MKNKKFGVPSIEKNDWLMGSYDGNLEFIGCFTLLRYPNRPKPNTVRKYTKVISPYANIFSHCKQKGGRDFGRLQDKRGLNFLV